MSSEVLINPFTMMPMRRRPAAKEQDESTTHLMKMKLKGKKAGDEGGRGRREG